jgi:hypothetical protein
MNQKDDRYIFFFISFYFIFIDDVLSISEIFVFLFIVYLSFNPDKDSIINFSVFDNRMKILGIGVDLVQNNRIKNILARSSHDLFLQKILHKEELDHFESLKQ